MSQTLSHPLLREQEESFTIYPHKGKVFLVSLLCALFLGGCFWCCAANASSLAAYVGSLQPVQKWAGAMLAVLIPFAAADTCLIPLVLLLRRSPLLTFTEEGVYNYYRLGLQPQFLKWEDIQTIHGVTARRYHFYTTFHIRRVPNERQALFREQRAIILVLLADLFYRYAVSIPQWVMPLPVNEVLQQVKQKYALPLQHHHISVYALNVDSGKARDY